MSDDSAGTPVSRLADSAVQGERDGSTDELSRREWLLNFGSAIVLSGFAGVPGGALQTDPQIAAALPPGLYTPSIDHVTHALTSDGPFFPFSPGAEIEFTRARSIPYAPQ